jgi:two-component system, NarL family, response regulator NreC
MPIRILVGDDHSLIRQGIRNLFSADPNLAIVAEASNGVETVNLARKYQPDIAIVDISMKELNGIDAIAQIVRHSPGTSVIILSMYNDERYVNRAVRAGAKAYVLKDSADDDLLRAVYAVAAQASFFSPAIAKVLLEAYTRNASGEAAEDRYELLTERERQIYQMLAEGHTNKGIAAALSLSIHTVETHRVRIMSKLKLHNTAELTLSAVRRGIVS